MGKDKEPFAPWLHKLSIWKTQSEYFIFLRGWLRRIWADNPLKAEWKKSKLRPVTGEERAARVFHPATKQVAQCYLCNQWFAGSKLEVDHIVPSEGCYDFNTAEKFLWHCAASDPDNWALACQPCHKIKSYADREGVTFDEAKAIKQAISVENSKKVNEFLKQKGITPASNAKLRRKQLVEYFKEKDNATN